MRPNIPMSRRTVLRAGGALLVSCALRDALEAAVPPGAPLGAKARAALAPDSLSSYLAVQADGTIAAFFGKLDMGQGLVVAIGQIVAEELDVPFDRVQVVVGDTATTVNQGDASAQCGVQLGGRQMRAAAAEARRVLIEMAARTLGLEPDQLVVTDGIVHAVHDRTKQVSYADLIGDRHFDVTLDWNRQIGNQLFAPGKAEPKPASSYRIVGQPIKRQDVAPKVFCQQDYNVDVKVPGMVHGRILRPPVAGAVPVNVDHASVQGIPGVQIVWQKDFLGLVAETEWDAIKAQQALAVQWSASKPAFPGTEGLYDHIRQAPIRKRQVELNVGDIDRAFAGATEMIEAEYEWPFQSHASMGPGCGLVKITDGKSTCWTGSQKAHFTRDGIAAILGLPVEDVRVIWVTGTGSYGRNDAGDAAIDAAVLARAVGRPVRVQYDRGQGHGWDPKGPASIHRIRAAVDRSGNVVGYDFVSKGFSRVDCLYHKGVPAATLAGQLLGAPLASQDAFLVPSEDYVFANRRLAWETIAPLLDRTSPLRTSHLRDPLGPQLQFAGECFLDELAARLKVDPVTFRLKYLKDPRGIAVINAAAEGSGWFRRSRSRSGTVATGMGFSYAQRDGTYVAMVATVDVDLATGKVSARKVTLAHDCGLVINPDGLTKTIEGNVVQALSRTLWEEVTFDDRSVTSADWTSYPILDISETPHEIDLIVVNRPEFDPTGAGEASTGPVASAVANALFAATGVRLRRAPLTPDRVKAALGKA